MSLLMSSVSCAVVVVAALLCRCSSYPVHTDGRHDVSKDQTGANGTETCDDVLRRQTADAAASDVIDNCAQFFSCSATALGCQSVVHSTASQLCQHLRHEHRLRQPLDSQVMSWAKRMNNCVVRRLAENRLLLDHEMTSSTHRQICSEADARIRTTSNECARQLHQETEAASCRTILWTGRQTTLAVIGHRNWLRLVELMSFCQRHDVDRFIRWVLSTSPITVGV